MDAKDQAVIEKTLQDLIGKGMGELEENVKKSLDELLDARVQKYMEENKIDLKSLPKNVGGEKEDQKYATIGKFINSVFQKDIETLKKGMTEGSDSAGGFLVPEEFHAEVMRISKDYGLVSKFAQRFNMKRDTLNVPVASTSVTTYWVAESAAATASTPAVGNAVLQAKKLVGMTVSSNELLADAEVDTVEYLMTLFAEEMAGELDNQAFNGTGSPFVGIFNDANVTTVTMASGQDTFAEVKLTDLRNLISNVPTSCLSTAAYFMHPLTWGLVQNIQEGSQTIAAIQNQLINVGVGADKAEVQKPAGFLWGYPVYLSDKIVSTTAVSTKFIAFGSMKKGLFFGDRSQTTMKITEDASVGGVSMFETDQSAVRVTIRAALKVGLPGAFAVLKTAAS